MPKRNKYDWPVLVEKYRDQNDEAPISWNAFAIQEGIPTGTLYMGFTRAGLKSPRPCVHNWPALWEEFQASGKTLTGFAVAKRICRDILQTGFNRTEGYRAPEAIPTVESVMYGRNIWPKRRDLRGD
jgi:hypothetical protein